MGLFSKKKPAQTSEQAPVQGTKVKVDLSKRQESLNRVMVDLSKHSRVDLSKHAARVAQVIDRSGSMSELYKNGDVQEVVERLFPLALRFDDNGELESWIFENGFNRLEAVEQSNYSNYVQTEIEAKGYDYGGTNYSPVIQDLIDYYVKENPSSDPAFVIFITDGENSDKSKTDSVVRELSKHNIFIQFVGIGHASFNYLRKLDDLSGRVKDNTGFIKVSDMNKMTDDELYKALLEQYIEWLNGNQ